MKKALALLAVSIGLTTMAQAQVNAVITDGKAPFAEGKLKGYIVQAGGRTICTDPYSIGKYISCAKSITVAGQVYIAPDQKVWADTNGTLGAMVVLGPKGRVLCKNPSVSNQFRGPDSYILCE